MRALALDNVGNTSLRTAFGARCLRVALAATRWAERQATSKNSNLIQVFVFHKRGFQNCYLKCAMAADFFAMPVSFAILNNLQS